MSKTKPLKAFGGRVTGEKVAVIYFVVPSLLYRNTKFIQDILTHDLITELGRSPNIQRQPPDFAADFARVSGVTVVLGVPPTRIP